MHVPPLPLWYCPSDLQEEIFPLCRAEISCPWPKATHFHHPAMNMLSKCCWRTVFLQVRWIKRCNRVVGVYPCLRDKNVQALCTDKHHTLALSEHRIFHHLLYKISSSTHTSEYSCKLNKTCCSFLEISPELCVMTARALQLNFPFQNWISPHSTPGIHFQRLFTLPNYFHLLILHSS